VSAEAIIELLGVTTATYSSRRREDQNKFSRMLESDRDIAEFLRGREQQAPVRLDVKNTDVPINFGDHHGVDVLGGYMAGLPENLIRSEAHSERSKTVLAVTHDMAKAPDREGQVSLYEGKSGLKVFRNPETRPRAWSVHQAIPATILAGLRDRLQVQPLDVHRQTILLAETPALESCDGDVIKIVSRSPSRMRCTGDAFYPAWEAAVDGKPARIWEAYGFVRGVVAPAGAHQIDRLFRPGSFYAGGALFMMGLLLTAVLVCLRR